MNLRVNLLASFRSVATGTLRLDAEAADAFSEHITAANDGIHVIGQLCTGPNALDSATLALMLDRWFRLLSEYASPRLELERKVGTAQTAPELSPESGLLLHARVLEVCISQRGLSEPQAMHVATHVRASAPAFFALEQKCRAPDRHSQRLLCATLRAALGKPLDHAEEAASVYLRLRGA
jgi:hypothetical protein